MRRLIYNDDSQGVSETRPGQAATDLAAWVDKPLKWLNIDTYVWCICFPDICMHRTKVGEVYGERFANPPNRAAATIAELHAQDTDVLHVVAAQARRHGVEFIAGVRMNDTHGLFPDPRDPQISQVLIDHPEWVIRRDDGVPERALDYSLPQVRQHRLAILRELAENYDIDGIELDFTRWAKFFPRNEAPAKAPLMTQFVGQVRQMLDEVGQARGRRFALGVQVLESLYLNLLAGLEPKHWVEESGVDFLIQCDFNCTNPQLPVTEFAQFCRPADCTHHVRMGNMMAGGWSGKPHARGRTTAAYKNNPSYGGMVLMPEEARGAAANIYGFGADGIGLWNICCNLGDQHKPGETGRDRKKFQEDMMAWIEAVDTPEKVWAAPRSYHFLPIYKRETLPVRNYPVNALLQGPTGWPTQIVCFSVKAQGQRLRYRFLCADGERSGDRLQGLMRWRILGALPEDLFRFDLNDEPLHVDSEVEADEELPAVLFTANLEQCAGLAGANALGLTLEKLSAAERPWGMPYMEELEIRVCQR
ncbi:MAG: hypothetical protein GKR89_12935 [Candidatus Latescibacteria bacterium]|nr:hypothetical protein [Candidatus Latescibacterota bacterium]